MSYSAPSNWQKFSLGELTSTTRPICYGVLKPGEHTEGGVPLVRITDISGNYFDDSDLYLISEDLDREFSRSKLAGGEILISIQGTIGRVAICPEKYKGANISRTIAVIEPDDRACKRYVYWFLRYYGKRELFDAYGATRASLNIGTLRALEIPLPPLAEQKRIAAILDKADAIRRKRQQAIQLADDFLRAVFLEMFGDPVTNPKGWRQSELKDVCEKVIDCPHSTPVWTENGVIGLRTSNLTKGGWNWDDKRFVSEATYLERSSRAELLENDIILSREGTVGVAALVPPNTRMCMGQRLVQLRVNLNFLSPEYLLYFLLYELDPVRISRILAGSTSKHLNVRDLKSLKVALPPLSMQKQFAEVSRKLKQQETKFSKSAVNLNLSFDALSQKAFSGQL